MGPELTVGTAAADAAALQKSCGQLYPAGSSQITQQWVVERSSGAALLQSPFEIARLGFGN